MNFVGAAENGTNEEDKCVTRHPVLVAVLNFVQVRSSRPRRECVRSSGRTQNRWHCDYASCQVRASEGCGQRARRRGCPKCDHLVDAIGEQSPFPCAQWRCQAARRCCAGIQKLCLDREGPASEE